MNNSPATNPKQYDSPDLDWSFYGAEDNASRIFFREALGTVMNEECIQNKRVLDIGCGIGQLFNWLKGRGVSTLVGIDPSDNNISISREKYPWATLVQSTLEEFAGSYSGKKFDTAVAIMVFEHIQDLAKAFEDIATLLTQEGEFYLIIADKDFYISNDKTVRGGHFVSVEILRELENGAVETKTIRTQDDGRQIILFDISHPLPILLEAAERSGFSLFVQKPLLGPISRSAEERDIVFAHALGFRRV